MPPLLFLALFAGCHQPEPPTEPELTGPGFAQPGETVAVKAASHDANGGNVAYRFDWGDGTATAWSAELAEGDTFSAVHPYADTGAYAVRVKARDETRRESDWSDPLLLRLGFAGPVTPAAPQGAPTGYPDTALWFSASAGHVRNESVSVQFDWGDTLGSWTDFVPAGAAVSDSHRFLSVGNFRITARARDRAGNTSPWSAASVLSVVMKPVEPPHSLRLAASSGIYIRLSWETGRNSDTVRYQVWFRPLGAGEFSRAGQSQGVQALHDPLGMTGEYTMSAMLDTVEVFGPDTLSTVPLRTDTLVLGELNMILPGGYGWDTVSGRGRVRSMLDTLSAPLTDLYFTDLTPGFLGPGYYMATPSFGPDDPGGVVPEGPWRRSGLLGLLGSNQDPLPEYDSLYYQRVVDVNTLIANLAVYTQDGYYALVQTLGPNLNEGTIPVVAWFQRIRGLRLIAHLENK